MAASPYVVAAGDYLAAGWSPIPLQARSKFPPPDGLTGAAGRYVTAADVRRWSGTGVKARCTAGNLSYLAGNVALRLPRDVLGVDVDAYPGKGGAETLAAREAEWGKLPPAWISTSRPGGLAGIRLYRVPAGLAWPGNAGPGVDLIRFDHRYVVAPPSIHPEGGAYFWIAPSGLVVSDEIPAADDLPSLPSSWVEGLTAGKEWVEREAASLSVAEVAEWIEARGGKKDALCVQMSATVAEFRTRLREATDGGGAHDAGRDGAWAVLRDARDGHTGLWRALHALKRAFLAASSARRKMGEAEAEWTRAVERGVAKVVGDGVSVAAEDMCAVLASGWDEAEEDSVSAAAPSYPRTDIGNGKRLIDRHGTSLRWVPETGAWAVWSGGLWKVDAGGLAARSLAHETVAAMENEKKFYLTPKARGEFLSFVRGSGNAGKLTAMLGEATVLPGVSVPAGAWDARPDLLGVADGVVELGLRSDVAGASLRAADRSDLVTMSTRVPWVRGSVVSSGAWSDFLQRFFPDKEIRLWLQKLVGYSILGANPLRLFVVCYGSTSTGKTTFAEIVKACLGDYACESNLTVFRDNQDERPRADLVRILKRRMVFLEETSASWHMHPDQVKRLTGDSSMVARLPYAREYVEAVPAFTPWLLTNSAPTIEGADQALWRRLVVVPFDVVVQAGEEDPAFRLRVIEEEREAVLDWAVTGYELYRRDPSVLAVPPLGAVQAGLEFRRELSQTDIALSEIAEFGGEYCEVPSALYDAYTRWCDLNGVGGRDRLSGTTFGKQMTGKGFLRVKISRSGSDVWVRRGLRLNPEYALFREG